MTSPLFPVDPSMAVDTAAALSRVASAAPATADTAPTGTFMNMVGQGLQQVNDRLLDSQVDMQGLASGGGSENLHQVMIRLEESRISFQLMLQVRNRLLESYQELMRMQI
jgi:flagellar hook-basal body complex protein FliE